MSATTDYINNMKDEIKALEDKVKLLEKENEELKDAIQEATRLAIHLAQK